MMGLFIDPEDGPADRRKRFSSAVNYRAYVDPSARVPEWPATVRMNWTVRAEMWGIVGGGGPCPTAQDGKVYRVTSNRFGALCAVTLGGELGIKPDEFEVVTWRPDRPRSAREMAQENAAAWSAAESSVGRQAPLSLRQRHRIARAAA